jgi:hypothetical protein
MISPTEILYTNRVDSSWRGFLATVNKVYTDENSTSSRPLKPEEDSTPIYNQNKNWSTNDSRLLGAIEFKTENTLSIAGIAYPFEKNLITFPIANETVVILQIGNEYFWIPFSNSVYPNYRKSAPTAILTEPRNDKDDKKVKQQNIKEVKNSGIVNTTTNTLTSEKVDYEIKEKIKYLRPKTGDTIITGRVGNSIRFSEFFLTEDGKTSSPSIFIRNKQNPELDDKKIGELVEEDINKDGTSIYIVSNKVKVPFDFKNVSKQTIAFKDFPSTKSLTGDQLYVNSDRVVLSAKAKEFIIYGKGNSGAITDGRFSIDAKAGVYAHSENDDITLHTINGKNIFLNSDSSGKIYLGKNKGEGGAGADVQKMVLGGELVSILEEILDAITQQVYLTPSGPTATGPTNSAKFNSIKNKLNTILSGRNFLSKQ